MKKVLLVSATVLVAVVLIFTNRQRRAQSPSTSATQSQPSLRPTDTPKTQAAQQSADVTIEMNNFTFLPSSISVKPGSTVTVSLLNKEGNHNFVVPDLGVKTKLYSLGEQDVVTLTIPADAPVGKTYEFFCFPHRSLRMVGTISVVAP